MYGAGEPVKRDGALFGPPKPESGLPRTYAKMDKSGMDKSSERFTYTDKRKSAVPSKEDVPILGITTSKNFITANAVEAILMGNRNSNF